MVGCGSSPVSRGAFTDGSPESEPGQVSGGDLALVEEAAHRITTVRARSVEFPFDMTATNGYPFTAPRMTCTRRWTGWSQLSALLDAPNDPENNSFRTCDRFPADLQGNRTSHFPTFGTKGFARTSPAFVMPEILPCTSRPLAVAHTKLPACTPRPRLSFSYAVARPSTVKLPENSWPRTSSHGALLDKMSCSTAEVRRVTHCVSLHRARLTPTSLPPMS